MYRNPAYNDIIPDRRLDSAQMLLAEFPKIIL